MKKMKMMLKQISFSWFIHGDFVTSLKTLIPYNHAFIKTNTHIPSLLSSVGRARILGR